jgi:hypothetical protein
MLQLSRTARRNRAPGSASPSDQSSPKNAETG